MQIQSLRTDIEQRLSTAEPGVEVLACEKVGPERLRLFIDHPDGVDLALCERVTKHLTDLLMEYGLEVSSPGPERLHLIYISLFQSLKSSDHSGN